MKIGLKTFLSRFKRRILHSPNLIAELSACKMRRLNRAFDTIEWEFIPLQTIALFNFGESIQR